ncbi:ion transporter [Cryptosporangium arvum]|uniref:Ion transport protein n=1 Tax=Cryptosporangium arvum DSM 44712 TaxID=927661 RepID=A0A011AES9_9ACTN|nr:ion transporter [Cryptosporangium arvum]EXG80546.1 Ion transport protein [Cryptosporangium arvum DSM 44712]
MIRIVLRRLAGSCREVVAAPWFNLAGFVVIMVNAVALGLETYDPVVSAAGPLLHAVEYACVLGFAAELAVRFGAHLEAPSRFFRDRWNLFDLVIVAAPLLPGVRENVTLLRLLRLARIVRTFRLFPSLRVILVGIRRSLPGLASFLLVTVLVLYGYAMLGWMMFGEAYPERFGTVGQAMLTLFLLLSLDGITDTLEAGREVTSWAVLYYVSYMVAACYLLTNLLVGLVLTALQEAHEDERDAKLVVGSPEHSVREQLAQMRALIDALERQLPPARPAPVRVGGAGSAERSVSSEAAPRELP